MLVMLQAVQVVLSAAELTVPAPQERHVADVVFVAAV